MPIQQNKNGWSNNWSTDIIASPMVFDRSVCPPVHKQIKAVQYDSYSTAVKFKCAMPTKSNNKYNISSISWTVKIASSNLGEKLLSSTHIDNKVLVHVGKQNQQTYVISNVCQSVFVVLRGSTL